ncbi:hypothetical protein ACN2AU_04795 [Aerococcus viridans]
MVGTVSDMLVSEFKDLYVRETGLGVESDEVFKRNLESAYQYVVDHSDYFDIETNKTGKMLVFDRARYVRANASELYYQNFLHDLNAFGLNLAMERDMDESTQDD